LCGGLLLDIDMNKVICNSGRKGWDGSKSWFTWDNFFYQNGILFFIWQIFFIVSFILND